MKIPRKIDLGCGRFKRKNFFGIDKFYFPGVDKVFDIEKGIPLKDNTVEEVYTSHFLEHVDNFEFIFQEILRVCKPNAKITVRVPHFSGRSAFFEFHKCFFRYGSFQDFEERADSMIPGKNVRIKIIKRRLIFLRKPYLPLNGLLESIINKNPRLATLYEETFLRNLFPAFEMKFEMKVIKK